MYLPPRDRYEPVDEATRQSLLAAALGKWAEVRFLNGPYLDDAQGWLSLCEDSDEIVLEGDGGATFVRIPTLVSITVKD